MKKYGYKEIDKAIQNFSMFFRNDYEDIGHGFASAHGALTANLEMLLYRALKSEDEELQEYATEMIERFRDIHLNRKKITI